MKPATDLPWATRGPLKGRINLPLFIQGPKSPDMPYAIDICGDDYTGYGDEEAREQNLRYICHAANAYPELIATMADNLCAWRGEEESVKEEKRELIARTERLLIALGEIPE